MKNKIKWYLKQLLPLVYVSEYYVHSDRENATGYKELCIWYMWFGHCFNIQTWQIAK